MTTLQQIHARCTECGECLLWQGATNGAGHPKLHNKSARRAVYEMAKGKLPKTMKVGVNCGQAKCLRIAHLETRSVSEISKISNAQPATKLKRQVKTAKSARSRLGKITMEIAREWRNSDRPGVELAREADVSPSLVSLVRRGKSWVEHSNPFAGLMT